VYWYKLAAEQGLPEAQFALAVMYDNGQGVAQDYPEAVRIYRLLANENMADAEYNLG